MKRTAILLMSAALTACASAQQPHEHAAPAQPGAMMSGGMHEHMKLMREQMAQIRAAQDPKERERLMNEHMKTMEQSMAKMQGMQGMGCGKM